MSLKDPKKIEETEEFAIFKGSNGHEIKILKKALSGKLKKELEALPLHAFKGEKIMSTKSDDIPEGPSKIDEAIERYQQSGPKTTARVKGEGARAAQEANNELIKDTILNIAGGEGAWKRASAEPAVQEDTSQALSQGPMSTPQDGVNEAPPDDIFSQAAASPDPTQVAAPQPLPPKPRDRETYVRDVMAERNREDQDWDDGLSKFEKQIASQGVTAKSYSEALFHDKKLPGKIGAIFGLILSGAGSGLTRGPNLLIEMMNKEIERDLEAQKTTKTNVQNFVKMAQEHQLRKAQMKEIEAKRGLIGAQERMTLTESQLKEAQLKAWAEYNNGSRISIIKGLEETINQMPPEQRGKAQQVLNELKAVVGEKVLQTNMKVAEQLADDPEASFQEEQRKLRSMEMIGIPGGTGVAENKAQRHVPGFGDASIPVKPETRNELVGGLEFEKAAWDYVNFAKKNWKNFANLDLVEREKIANQGKVKAANLTAAYRKATNGGVFKAGEQDFINTIIPDKAASWKAAFSQIPKVEENINHMRMRTNNTARSVFGGSYEPPVFWKGNFYRKGPNGKAVRVY